MGLTFSDKKQIMQTKKKKKKKKKKKTSERSKSMMKQRPSSESASNIIVLLTWKSCIYSPREILGNFSMIVVSSSILTSYSIKKSPTPSSIFSSVIVSLVSSTTPISSISVSGSFWSLSGLLALG